MLFRQTRFSMFLYHAIIPLFVNTVNSPHCSIDRHVFAIAFHTGTNQAIKRQVSDVSRYRTFVWQFDLDEMPIPLAQRQLANAQPASLSGSGRETRSSKSRNGSRDDQRQESAPTIAGCLAAVRLDALHGNRRNPRWRRAVRTDDFMEDAGIFASSSRKAADSGSCCRRLRVTTFSMSTRDTSPSLAAALMTCAGLPSP